ncbi:MAG: hypothetical protein LCH54_02840 [Bacteroidetes bacterium]|nr:hypothetical protein [Bacteroidota bacterium]
MLPYTLFYLATILVCVGIYQISKKTKNGLFLFSLMFIPVILLLAGVLLSGLVKDIRYGVSMISFAMWTVLWFFQDRQKDGLFFMPFSIYYLGLMPLTLLTLDFPSFSANNPELKGIRIFLSNNLMMLISPVVTFSLVKMISDVSGKITFIPIWLSGFISLSAIVLSQFFNDHLVLPSANILIDLVWLVLIVRLLTVEFLSEYKISFNRLGLLTLVLMMLIDDFSLIFDTLGSWLGLPSVGKENSYVRFYLNQLPQLFILSYYFIDFRVRQRFGFKLAKPNLD